MKDFRRCIKCQTGFYYEANESQDFCDYHRPKAERRRWQKSVGYPIRIPLSLKRSPAYKETLKYKKYLARKRVEKAVVYGKLLKPPTCSHCSSDLYVIHGHHNDYDKPLEVVWLCQPCHALHHSLTRKGLPSPYA